MKKIIVIIALLFAMPTIAFSKHIHQEKWYQDRWCAEANGKTEIVLADKVRCDCITDTHSIEFDFGEKWAESIGQSLYYSFQTGKRAGIVLIIENPEHMRYYTRVNSLITFFDLPIDTWKIDQSFFKK